MTTLTIKINKKTKAGKAFLAMSETFLNGVEGIEIVENNSTNKKTAKESPYPYDPEFVEMVLKANKNGKYTTINPNDIWASIL